jgi:outer membrane protein assembly factor BamB
VSTRRLPVGCTPSGTLLWRFQGTAGDEPVVHAASGAVYATGKGQPNGNCQTYAIDAATGKLIWRTADSGPRPYTAGAGAVYGFTVTDSVTRVVASSAATGRTLWTHDAGRWLDNAKVGWLAYADGLVYSASGTTEFSTTGLSTVRALNARTGHRAWTATLTAPSQQQAVGERHRLCVNG